MLTCCLDCKKHADNISSKKWPWWIKWLEVNQDVLIVWLINQDFQNKGLIKKSGWNNINQKSFIYKSL